MAQGIVNVWGQQVGDIFEIFNQIYSVWSFHITIKKSMVQTALCVITWKFISNPVATDICSLYVLLMYPTVIAEKTLYLDSCYIQGCW